MSKGWISIHRKLQCHWVWEDKPFSKGQAWIDLLMLANHEDSKFLLGNQLVEAKRGDVVTSEVKLAKRWGWSRTKVRAFLDLLEADLMLIKKSDSKKTALTLVNYGLWQDSKTDKEQQKNSDRTAIEQQENTINNSNNSNNSNNISSSSSNKFADDAVEISLSSELYNLMLQNNPRAKKPNLQSWAKHIDLMIRIDKRNPIEIQKVIQWSQKDSFWQSNILSTKKLREKYDQLTMKMGKQNDLSKEVKSVEVNSGDTRPKWETDPYIQKLRRSQGQ